MLVSSNPVQLSKSQKKGCLRRKLRRPFAFNHHRRTTKGHASTISTQQRKPQSTLIAGLDIHSNRNKTSILRVTHLDAIF
jgi:hypothetical protein